MAYRSGDVSLVSAPFPRGGSYADIHHALIEEGYTDGRRVWLSMRGKNGWRMKTSRSGSFFYAKTGHRSRRTTILRQFARSDDHVRIGCCEDNARSQPLGMPRKLPVWVIACGLECRL